MRSRARSFSRAHLLLSSFDDVDDEQYRLDPADFPQLADLIAVGDCLGTVIAADALLTVAHCAVDLTAGGTLTIDGASVGIASVALHPQWQDQDEFDITVVHLVTDVSVAPLRVYRGDDEISSEVRLHGRGTTATGLVGENGGHDDAVLQRATNIVASADAQFIRVIFEAPGQAGITALEGVGAAGDSGTGFDRDRRRGLRRGTQLVRRGRQQRCRELWRG